MDLTFNALTPAVGVDGQGRQGSGASAATGTSVGKGHLEQAGRWTGWIEADGVRHEMVERARQPRQVVGPAAVGRSEDVALVLDQHRRRRALRRASASGPTRATCTAGGCGRDGEHSSIKEWKVTSEVADDGVTHTATHVHATDKRGRVHELDADVFRVSPGPAGIRPDSDDRQRGSRPLDLRGPHRLRHQRVPAPARLERAPGRPDRVAVDQFAVDLAIVAAVFPAIFIAELPDKSMFASLVMASRGRPFMVWLGTAAAFAVHVVIAVSIGVSLFKVLPQEAVDVVVAILFGVERGHRVRCGVRGGGTPAGDHRRAPRRTACSRTAFIVIFLAEWGDLTQVLTANLAVRYGSALSVGLGATLALWAVAGLAVLGGHGLLARLPARGLRLATGSVLAVLAVVSLVAAFA